MDYNYNYNQKGEAKKKRVISVLVVLLSLLLIANLVMFGVITSAMNKAINEDLNASLKKMEYQLDGRIDDALANRLTTTISEQVSDNILGEVTTAATSFVNDYITTEIIDKYKREYNLPEDYFGIGVIAAQEVGSVLELETTANLNQPYQNQTKSSQSSAFVINTDGYVFTNAHCVTFEDGIYEYVSGGFFGGGWRETGTETRVFTSILGKFRGSAMQYEMEVVHYNTEKDLAIIKFVNPPANLQPVTFGDSSLLTLGEEVAAIGNAQGLGISLTTGVVSNTTQQYYDVRIIQTDTTINPGNSGGPLFNIYGEMVGIVSFKIIESALNEGLGFAISSDSAKAYIIEVETEKNITIAYEQIEE